MGTAAFNKEHYEQLILRVKKGWSTAVRETAQSLNLSLNKFIQLSVEAQMEKCTLKERAFPSTSKRTYRVILRDKNGKRYRTERFKEKDLLRTDDKGALRFVANDDTVLTVKVRPAIDALNNHLAKINEFLSDIKDPGGAKILADELMEKFFKAIVYTPSEGSDLSSLFFVAMYQDTVDPSIIICSDKRLIVQYMYNEVNLSNGETWTIEEMEE